MSWFAPLSLGIALGLGCADSPLPDSHVLDRSGGCLGYLDTQLFAFHQDRGTSSLSGLWPWGWLSFPLLVDGLPVLSGTTTWSSQSTRQSSTWTEEVRTRRVQLQPSNPWVLPRHR